MEAKDATELRVLLIEGDAKAVSKMKQTLGPFAPLDLVIVDSPESARRALKKGPFSLILADLQYLESEIGSQLMKDIRTHAPGTATIVFFKKPIRKGQLIQSIAYALSRRRGAVQVHLNENQLALLRSLLALALQAESLITASSEILKTISFTTGFSSVAIWVDVDPLVRMTWAEGKDFSEDPEVTVAMEQGQDVWEFGEWEDALEAPVQEIHLPLKTGRKIVGKITLRHPHPIEPEPRLLRFISSLGWEIQKIIQRSQRHDREEPQTNV
jgi:hypothetical protein